VDMAPKYILEQFLEAELLVNITEHQVNVSVLNLSSFTSVVRQYVWSRSVPLRYLLQVAALRLRYLNADYSQMFISL